MKTHVLMLSKNFLAKHPKKGQLTYFKTKFLNAQDAAKGIVPAEENLRLNHAFKKHTIREDLPKWKHIFEEIARGEACLSIREWSGRPRQSAAIEIKRLTANDGISLQELRFMPDRSGEGYYVTIDGKQISVDKIADNDGLSLAEWSAWFKDVDKSQPLAVIQFTRFRY